MHSAYVFTLWIDSCLSATLFLLWLFLQAIQRSRLRIAAAQQQSQRPEQSPQSVNMTTTPGQAEQNAPHSADASQAVASGSGSTERETVASPATTLAGDNLRVHSSPVESSLETPSKPMDPALAGIVEKKLSSSREKIEKLVRRNRKRTPKAAQASRKANRRRNLMSMRWIGCCNPWWGRGESPPQASPPSPCLLLP